MKKLFFLIVLIMFSCSSNDEVLRTEPVNIEIETICNTGNVRTYEISANTMIGLEEFFAKHGTNCTWVQVQTTSGDTKAGYFVRFY